MPISGYVGWALAPSGRGSEVGLPGALSMLYVMMCIQTSAATATTVPNRAATKAYIQCTTRRPDARITGGGNP